MGLQKVQPKVHLNIINVKGFRLVEGKEIATEDDMIHLNLRYVW